MRRLHLARRLGCRLEGVGMYAANTAAYDRYRAPLPVACEVPVGGVREEMGRWSATEMWKCTSLEAKQRLLCRVL